MLPPKRLDSGIAYPDLTSHFNPPLEYLEQINHNNMCQYMYIDRVCPCVQPEFALGKLSRHCLNPILPEHHHLVSLLLPSSCDLHITTLTLQTSIYYDLLFFSFSKNPFIFIPSFFATDRVVWGCGLGGSFCFFVEVLLMGVVWTF